MTADDRAMTKYAHYIAQLIATTYGGDAKRTFGQCRHEAKRATAAFPELRFVQGHVYTDWGKRSHCWTETADGTIVDPTKGQFNVVFEYEEYRPGDPVRLGSCANCGEGIWGQPDEGWPTVCSSECHNAYVAYLNAGR